MRDTKRAKCEGKEDKQRRTPLANVKKIIKHSPMHIFYDFYRLLALTPETIRLSQGEPTNARPPPPLPPHPSPPPTPPPPSQPRN